MEYDPRNDVHLQDADELEQRRPGFPETIREGHAVLCKCGASLIVPESYIILECPACGRLIHNDS